MELRSTLAADPRCVGEARRLVRTTLSSWGLAPLSDTASLLVSELMTNALLHARSAVEIVFSSGTAEVRFDVCDRSPLPPRVRHFSPDAGTGRGVRLLESLATHWGVERRAGGKCVWFTLSTEAPAEVAAWEFDFDAVDAL